MQLFLLSFFVQVDFDSTEAKKGNLLAGLADYQFVTLNVKLYCKPLPRYCPAELCEDFI